MLPSLSSCWETIKQNRRYWVYGIIVFILILLGLVIRKPGQKRFSKSPYSLSSSFAYCNSPGIHANCFFSRSLCYNTNLAKWQTSIFPFTNWSGVSLRSRGALFRDSEEYAGCNPPFVPKLLPMPSGESIFWVKGTNVFACLWLNVFGHMFLEMMLPAWMSVRTIADQLDFSADKVGYILDDHYGIQYATDLFKLLTDQQVVRFSQLVDEAKLKGKLNICFERVIIGFRLQAALEFPQNAAHLEVGDLARYRDTIKRLHGIPMTVDMSANKCIALLIQRAATRKIKEESEKKMVEMLQERTLCQVKVATFDGLSLIEQVRLVSTATIFIHVSGSGSHHFIWLSDGAASIALIHPYLLLKTIGNGGPSGGGLTLNDFLCWKHPTILCVAAEAKALGTTYDSDVQIDMESFSVALDMVKLWQKRGKFDPRDQTE